jgi:hypothetical protein
MALPLGTLPCLMTHRVLTNAKTPCSRNSYLTRKGIFVLLDLTIMRHRDCFGRHWLQAVLRRFLVSFHPYPRRSKKWQLGLASALSVSFTTFSQQVGFQHRANWHYRKVHRIRTLRRRLEFELPTSPTADNIAAVSNARSAMGLEMSKEWEDMKLAKEP